MSYSAHNFITGDRLTAEALNEIDSQVAINTAAQESQQAEWNNFANKVKEEILNNLQIVKNPSSDTFSLYYGPKNSPTLWEPIGSPISLAIATDNFVLCSGVQITNSKSTINIGETYPFAAQVNPSNTTQTLNWQSENTSAGRITAGGLFTATNVGQTNIIASCGDNRDTFNVNVQNLLYFTSTDFTSIYVLGEASAIYYPRSIAVSLQVQSGGRLNYGTCNYSTNGFLFNKYKVGPNQVLTVRFKSDSSSIHTEFHSIIIFKPYSPQIDMWIDNSSADAHRIREIEILEISPRIHEWYNKYGSVHEAMTVNGQQIGAVDQTKYNTGWGYHNGEVDADYYSESRAANSYGPNEYQYINNSNSDVYFIFNVTCSQYDSSAPFNNYFNKNIGTEQNPLYVFDTEKIANCVNEYAEVIIREATQEELTQ